ncbi:TPA: oxygen-regulated invasion protein OrgA [Salmonella enterica subsp. enterica serovar Saintpaul str. CFSAN004144]|nr:oxygen-regulated invasion protein OrgA [Salmonella enterica subsp. enterica serovar Saintpaul str. CFSAN004144]
MINPSFSTLLHQVVFDPLSYIHPQRTGIVPALITRPAERAAVNELLIRVGQLDTHIGESHHLLQDPVVQHLLRQWDLLVQTAFLLGCRARRGELAWQGKLLRLPEWARLFLQINLPVTAPFGIPKSVHGGLLCTGYSLLLGSFSHFPRFLTQRVSLLFPPQAESAQLFSPVDPLMLLLALQHAQRYPDKLFSSVSARWCTD